jgi:DNA repair photolyase
METAAVRIRNVLTRTTGYLRTVTSHSAQPYRGCSLGLSLCGVGCYVQHNRALTRGQPWGQFLEARENCADSYRENVDREKRWARKARGEFSIFLSSSTEPFLPQESRLGVTRSLLEAMLESPPDLLIVQTHSHRVAGAAGLLRELARRSRLRVHLSIETDLERLPGLPPHASSVEARFEAARELKAAGLETVITVSPLLPIGDPARFFARVAGAAGAVVLDHFMGGDGTPGGDRTLRTPLPAAMAALRPESVTLAYRDSMVEIAARHLPGRVGISIDGFAGRYLK